MASTSVPPAPAASRDAEPVARPAYTLGWRLFLALIVATPLAIGSLPPQFGAIATYRAFDLFGLPKAVVFLVLAGLSLAALCMSVLREGTGLRSHPTLWAIGAFVAWAGVSAALSGSPAVSVWGTYHDSEGLVALAGFAAVAFLAIQYVRSTASLRAVAAAAVISGSLVSVYALLQYVGIDPFGWVNETGRVFSTMGNADSLGSYLVFPLALAAGLALSGRRPRDAWPAWAGVGLIGLALLASETRGAWIAALAVALCIWLAARGERPRASRGRIAGLVGAAVVGLGAVSVAIVMIRPRLTASTATLSGVLTSISNGRTVIWLTGLRGWLAHPVTGWGPDGFGRAFQSAVGADWYAIIDGLQAAESAHNILVQTLVTLGVVGLLLLLWVLGRALLDGLRAARSVDGPDRMLFVASWAALVGMAVALLFSATAPGVDVWLWLAIGLVLAPISMPLRAPRRPLLVASAAAGVALALWAGSWLAADVVVGHAMQLQVGPAQVSELETAARIDPLTPNYRWIVADAMVNAAVALQGSGESAQAVDQAMGAAIAAYREAVDGFPGDALVRAGFANVLVGYAARHPGGPAAAQAVAAAQDAVRLAPGNPAALGALARAYDVSGRHADAVDAARLARSIAPIYAAQTLGTLGQ